MEELKQKSVYLIIFLLVISIIIGVILKSMTLTNDYKDKVTANSNYYSTDNTNTYNTQNNNNNNNNNNETERNDISCYNPTNTRYYYSSDDKYYLILTENIRRYSNSSMGTKDRRYLLNIDEYYSTSSFTGTYEINDNKITLYVEAGCTNEKKNFNCVIPDDIEIIKNNNLNTMTLDYSEKQIKFGTVTLTVQN